MNTETKNLIRAIKFAPLFVILFSSIIIIILMYQKIEKDFEIETQFIEKQYLESEKDRVFNVVNTFHNYVKIEKEQSEDKIKKALKVEIDIAHKIATNLYEKNKNTYTKKQIIGLIRDALDTMRFDEGRGYFSIHTIGGINILHPINRDFEGTSVLNSVDAKGDYPVQKAIEIANNNGEGFFTWYYYKPDDRSKEFKKMGIVKKFEPYDLIITTAIYIDNYEENLQKTILSNISNFKYKNDGFIYVINKDGKIILHQSKKALNHNVFKEKQFSHVNNFFKQLLLNEDDNDGAFLTTTPKVTYGIDTKEKNINYAKVFRGWNWIIATSFKLSDATKQIEQRKVFLQQKFDDYKSRIFLTSIIVVIILLIISFFIANLVEKKFIVYRKREEEQVKAKLKAKDKLLKINTHLKKLAENVPGVIYTFQLFPDGRSCFPFASEHLYDIYGVSANEVKDDGSKVFDVLYPEDLEDVSKSIQTSFKELTLWESEYRIFHPDKGTIWIKGMAKPEQQFDGSVLWYGYVYDITDIKLKDEMLINQSRNAAMGEMVSMIAHQWRQPLTVISMAANNMLMDITLDEFDSTEAKKYANSITEQTQHLSKTIDDFRNFFKPDKSLLKVNMREVLEKTLSIVKESLKNHNIDLTISYKTEKEIYVYPRELMQVFVNIINNAKDALKSVKQENPIINIEVYEDKTYIKIEICDNAGGIKDNIINQIFDPYFSTKDEKTGTGLGLYMSKMIIEKHLHGLIKVYNNKEGACFTVSLLKSEKLN